MTTVRHFDIADYLDTPERIAAYLSEVAKERDPASLQQAVESAARAHGLRIAANGDSADLPFRRVLEALDVAGVRVSFHPR